MAWNSISRSRLILLVGGGAVVAIYAALRIELSAAERSQPPRLPIAELSPMVQSLSISTAWSL